MKLKIGSKIFAALIISTIAYADTIPQTKSFESSVEAECNYIVLKHGKENKVGLSYLTGIANGVQTDKSYAGMETQVFTNYTFPIYKACIYALQSKHVKQKEIPFIDAVTKKLVEELNDKQLTPSQNRSL